ncbi:hypothetical protein INR49_011316 [Caranx melampygus]|nr:hypothetical protein INR49_011316 [Caranx melampygus]
MDISLGEQCFTYHWALLLLLRVGIIRVRGISTLDVLDPLAELIQLVHQLGHGVTRSSLNVRFDFRCQLCVFTNRLFPFCPIRFP